MSMSDPFEEFLAANEAYAAQFENLNLEARAAKGLAVLTCMDSRIDPLSMLGLERGDAKILRNAGARVTDDVLRTLVLATYLLSVERVMVVAHTGCRMTIGSEGEMHEAIRNAGGPDTKSLSFLTSTDLRTSLIQDTERIKAYPYLPAIEVGGFIYDLETGMLERIA